MKALYTILFFYCCFDSVFSQSIEETQLKEVIYAEIQTLDSILHSSSNVATTVGSGQFGSSWNYGLDTMSIKSGFHENFENHVLGCEKYNDLEGQIIYSKCTVDEVYSIEKFFTSRKEAYVIENGSLKSLSKKSRKRILEKLSKY